jgi:ketosteroid isomerase-like protein
VSAENVELVRRLQPAPDVDLVAVFRDDDAFAATKDRLAPFFDPDCEVSVGRDTVGRIEGTGLGALREIWLEWLEPWVEYRSEIERLIDLGERVIVLVRDFGRLEGGGPEVRMASGAIWTVREGRISRVVFYTTRESALEAAGLEPLAPSSPLDR